MTGRFQPRGRGDESGVISGHWLLFLTQSTRCLSKQPRERFSSRSQRPGWFGISSPARRSIVHRPRTKDYMLFFLLLYFQRLSKALHLSCTSFSGGCDGSVSAVVITGKQQFLKKSRGPAGFLVARLQLALVLTSVSEFKTSNWNHILLHGSSRTSSDPFALTLL